MQTDENKRPAASVTVGSGSPTGTARKPIRARAFLRLRMTLVTPLCVGSGENENSDHDCARDYDGNPFIPASSICGLLRQGMNESEAECLMGYVKGKSTVASRLRVSDGHFLTQNNTEQGISLPQPDVRDGVQLNENRVAVDHAKYDYEVLPSGTGFVTEMEFDLRDGEKMEDLAAPLYRALRVINRGELRLGYKTNRGLGVLKVEGKIKVFSCENGKPPLEESIAFRQRDAGKWDNTDTRELDLKTGNADELHLEGDNPEAFRQKMADETDLFNGITIEVKAKIPQTICVRSYASLSSGLAWDYDQLRDGKNAIIPGTSLAGAFRNTAAVFLTELGMKKVDVEKTLAWLFGHIHVSKDTGDSQSRRKDLVQGKSNSNQKQKPDSWSSNIMFQEVKLTGGHFLPMTRTKVDRFTSSGAYRALFSQRVYQGGETKLSIHIKNGKDGENLAWGAGLMLLVLRDLEAGLTPLGGEVAVGRGLLIPDFETLTINGESLQKSEPKYLKSLFDFLDGFKVPDYVHDAFAKSAEEDVP